MRGRGRLDEARARLARWRAQQGGRGIPVPEALWAEAVEVARVEGVEATARGLRLDRARLAVRVTRPRQRLVARRPARWAAGSSSSRRGDSDCLRGR